jgi:membrane protein implicated in regulation of membrane protease activity
MRLPGEPKRALPKHPFRDSAILYGVLSAIIVVVSAVTGGGVAKGLVIGIAFFVAATAWSWWRFRERLAQERSGR